jgi:hypothetical protein
VIWALVAVLLAVLVGTFLVRPRLKGHFKGDFAGIKTEAILGPIITLTVFLSAFVVAQATQTFQRANLQASTEAGAVGLMYQNAGLLPDRTGQELQGIQVCYARSVVNYGWPAMQQLKPSPIVNDWARQTNSQITALLDGPGSVVSQLVSLNRTEAETRAQRLYDAAPHLPILTLVLMIGAAVGVVLLLTSFAVPDMSRRVLLTLAFTLAVLLGGTLYLVEQLEEPFTGIVKVSPTQMQTVATTLTADWEVTHKGEALPCDATGKPVQ